MSLSVARSPYKTSPRKGSRCHVRARYTWPCLRPPSLEHAVPPPRTSPRRVARFETRFRAIARHVASARWSTCTRAVAHGRNSHRTGRPRWPKRGHELVELVLASDSSCGRGRAFPMETTTTGAGRREPHADDAPESRRAAASPRSSPRHGAAMRRANRKDLTRLKALLERA